MKQYSEKRSNPRIYYWKPITIEESAISFLYRARLVNYSETGLYFETDLLLNSGARVYVGIQNSAHRLFPKHYGRFLAEIIWRKPLTEISFNYGYGAKVLFDKAEKKLHTNKHVKLFKIRKNPRKLFSKLTYFASGSKFCQGIIKNLSRGGAFIETKTKFSNGSEIKLVVPGPNKYIQIRCEIIHFSQKGFGVKFKNVLKIDKSSEFKKSSSQVTR